MKVSTHVKIDFSPSARKVDENGFLHVDGVPMFRSGIVEITGMELQAWVAQKLDYSRRYRLRIQQEVIEKGYESFAHKPITWGHKWIGGNSKNDFIGFTGDNPYVQGDLICDSMTVADTDAVYRIGAKEREELSAGISGEIEVSSVPYADYDLLSFECNHVAVVKKGKAGHRVRILNEMIENGEIERENLMNNDKNIDKNVENPDKNAVSDEKGVKAAGTGAKEPATAVGQTQGEQAPGATSGEKHDTVGVSNENGADGADAEKQKDTEVGSQGSDDSLKVSVDDNVKVSVDDNNPAGASTAGDVDKQDTPEVGSLPETPKEVVVAHEPQSQTNVWVKDITGVVHSDNPDNAINGTTVEINFEEGGVYKYENGKVARIQLEEIVAESVKKTAEDMIEAFSICKKIDSGISLSKDTDAMYHSAARLVFGEMADTCSGESLKCMLQGYLLGKSANLSSECQENKDIRTIEINI